MAGSNDGRSTHSSSGSTDDTIPPYTDRERRALFDVIQVGSGYALRLPRSRNLVFP